MVLRIGFNPTRSTSPCHNNYTFMQYTVIQTIHTFTYIHKNESKHSEMGPVRQNPIQRDLLGLFICVCIALCTIVAHNIAQNRPDSFPPYPPDNHHSSDDVYLREGGHVLMCGARNLFPRLVSSCQQDIILDSYLSSDMRYVPRVHASPPPTTDTRLMCS